MPWLPGCPREPLPYTGSPLNPVACVFHRTIGRWGGDKAVLSRGRVPSVHWLFGQDPGQWVQWYSTDTTTAHAAGANGYAVGVEFSGQNSDVEELTDWQIECGAKLVAWLNTEHGIPRVFLERGPRVSEFRGFLNHANVQTTPQYTHYDFITKDAWDRMIGDAPAPPPRKKHRSKHMIFVIQDGAAGESYEYVGGPTTDKQSYIRLYGAEPLVNADRGAPVVSLNKAEFKAYVEGKPLNSLGARGWSF